MQIKPRNGSSLRKKAVEKEIQRAREMGPRPDPVCVDDCNDYDPSTGCHRDCEKAPVRLSSDTDEYPVEKKIVPLVFELKKTGVFYPCWSCEGHNDPSGSLWKIPRVWFYSDSVVHVRALANAVEHLFTQNRLSARWGVILTHSDANNPDTTFSLEPRHDSTQLRLDDLQSDVKTISEELASAFKNECEKIKENACVHL